MPPGKAAFIGAGSYRTKRSQGESGVTFAYPNALYQSEYMPVFMISFQKTDENGVATFTPEAAKVYEVRIAKVPDGYSEDETVYTTRIPGPM